MIATHPQAGRRGRRASSGRRRWRFSLTFLFLLATAFALLLSLFRVFRNFPLETLIMATTIAIAGIGVVLFIGELVVIGWVVDFLSAIGMPKFQAKAIPLEYEQVGEIVVVTLRDNIATVRHCQAVQKELRRLVDAHHCNFVLDFCHAGRISRSFRGVMAHLVKAARKEAGKLGKADRPVDLPRGEAFNVFEDRQRALAEMSRHGGDGWVVLCSVPVGIRAVFG